MLLNISNNTDIVQYYSKWLINRFEEGFFSIETEKMNNIYELTPKNFEVLVFQTKNPAPIINYLPKLEEKGFKYFFITTITPYSSEIEQGVDKRKIFESFFSLNARIGKERNVWKYAPVIINDEFTVSYHKKMFEKLCKKLYGLTNKCIVEFIENYESPIHASLYAPPVEKEKQILLLKEFKKIAEKYKISIYNKNTTNSVGKLIKNQIYKLIDIKVQNKIEILDMGLPNTCKGMCEYCYCGGNKFIGKKTNNYVNSPLFIGNVDKSKKHAKRRCVALT